jgi:transglutaminase-like putative cysteine protease
MRRTHTLVAVLSAALLGSVLPVGGPADASESVPSTEVAPRKAFRVTYRTTIPAPPAGTRRLEAWIPTPYVDDVQTVRDLKVTSSVPHSETRETQHGNRLVHVVVEEPKADVTVEWVALVERAEDRGQGTGAVLPAHLASDSLAPVDGRARELAEALGTTDAKASVRSRARTIYDHVLASMTYDKETPGWGKGDFQRSCDVGRGNCSDFASKFVTIARASGIPARWLSTISLSGDHMDCSACGYHCYAQYRDGDRWVPVDPSDARRIVAKDPRKADWYFGHAEANNIVLSMGRDLTLEPKQQAGPVNFLAGPYVEVDGKPFDVPSTNRTYGHEPAPLAAPAAAGGAPAGAR